MNSDDLREFSNWGVWPVAKVQAPKCPGVYVFRLSEKRCFGRMKGNSDIVYIGLSANVLRRLTKHAHEAKLWSTYWLGRTALEFATIEVAWKRCEKRGDAEELEFGLLRQYDTDHLELPPGNLQQPKKWRRKAFDVVSQAKDSPEVLQKMQNSVTSRIETLRSKARVPESPTT